MDDAVKRESSRDGKRVCIVLLLTPLTLGTEGDWP